VRSLALTIGSGSQANISGLMSTNRSVRLRLAAALRAVRRVALASPTPTKDRSVERSPLSSITDHPSYVEFCARAAEAPSVFETFRREPVYVETLEHVTEAQGWQYLRIIQRDSPHLLLDDWLQTAKANDQWGSPVTYDYAGVGRISPVTIRYLKVLSDLERLFGDLTGKRLVEIGVGYGGQARLILERWGIENYTLVDLPPVLRLAGRYLEKFGSYSALDFSPPEGLTPAQYDLCISNYAFSELSRDVQDRYAGMVVASALRSYLTCNFVSDRFGIDSWTKEELGRLHAGSRWIAEEPVTHEGNAILVWGDKGSASQGLAEA
jgi:putative sugar O-methyltransferase